MVPNLLASGSGRDVQKSAGTVQFLPVNPTSHPFGPTFNHPNSLYPSLVSRVRPASHPALRPPDGPRRPHAGEDQPQHDPGQAHLGRALRRAERQRLHPGAGRCDVDGADAVAVTERSSGCTEVRRAGSRCATRTRSLPLAGARRDDLRHERRDDGATTIYDRPFLPSRRRDDFAGRRHGRRITLAPA